ncbi:MAG: Ribosomal protein S12 methylthiotransferase RimO [Syntrophorhabdus sp. PtaB.Bin184]|nr:MAG: Ribosomal protein S12 methylthiotransferase RimO [Syntrophorhabdus sp. PtaB.Bin184]
MKLFLKALNSCVQRKQKILQYREYLLRNGHDIVADIDNAERIIIWTCAFRGDVRDNSLSEIRRVSRLYPGRVTVAGCLPDIAPEELASVFDGDIVPWKDESVLMDKAFMTDTPLSEVTPVFVEGRICTNTAAYLRKHPESDVTFPDEFVKVVVSEGCLWDCSYCSERLMFPPYRSFPLDELFDRCRELVLRHKTFDVMLLADSLVDYGTDTGTNLPGLIRKLSSIDPRVTFALNNLNPIGIMRFQDDFGGFFSGGRIKHLNIPIQSASDRILKAMNRPYSRADLQSIFGFLSNQGFTWYDTHLIVGFPGETGDDIERTIEFVIRNNIRYVLLSEYMEAGRAPSSRLPGKISREVIQERLSSMDSTLQRAGIITNSSNGPRMQTRFEKMNRDSDTERRYNEALRA